MSILKFCKMHGLGNDFVVIDGVSQAIDIKKIPLQKLAHRYVGIGFDQLLLIMPSTNADFSCRIFNSDGSEAEQCGNGMRCVARFIHDKGLSQKKSMTLQTKAGIVEAIIHDNENIQINMGAPCFEPALIPFNTKEKQKLYQLTFDSHPTLEIAVLSMGNPHAILQVESIENAPVAQLGPEIMSHPLFPQGTNVGFMEIVNPEHIRLRTFERGVGETYACGSNACAAVVAGIDLGLLSPEVTVELALGYLRVKWEGKEKPVLLTGSATLVFSGEIEI